MELNKVQAKPVLAVKPQEEKVAPKPLVKKEEPTVGSLLAKNKEIDKQTDKKLDLIG